jgi:DNA-binding MarR family transcriptional regulator
VLGSQATIHKRLHKLIEDGLLELIVQEDCRVKKVLPTAKANKLFNRLNKLMLKSAEN